MREREREREWFLVKCIKSKDEWFLVKNDKWVKAGVFA